MLHPDKQFKRQVQMLKYLSRMSHPTTTADLLEELACTKPTLLADIRSLNTQLPNEVRIVKQSRDGVELIYPDGKSIDLYITKLAKQSLVFEIIDSIFHGQIFSFQEAMDNFYVTKSVLLRAIGHMNQMLKHSHISISTAQVDFVGDESDIRFFLFAFYSDFRDCFVTLDEQDVDAEAYFDILVSSRRENFPQLHFSQFRTTIWIMVVRNRLRFNHYVKVPQSLIEEVKQHAIFPVLTKTIYEFSLKTFGIHEISQDDAVWMFITSLHCISYSTNSDTVDSTRPYRTRRDTSPEVIERVNQILLQAFPENIVQSDAVDSLRSFLINMRLLVTLTPRFSGVSFPLKNFMKNSYPKIYHTWLETLQTQTTNFYPAECLDDMAISLTLLQTSMPQQHSMKQIRVLFSFQGEAGYDDFLVHRSKQMLRKTVNAYYAFERSVNKKLIEEVGADIVVCNYDLPLIKDAPCQILRFSYIPTLLECELLTHILDHLQQE